MCVSICERTCTWYVRVYVFMRRCVCAYIWVQTCVRTFTHHCASAIGSRKHALLHALVSACAWLYARPRYSIPHICSTYTAHKCMRTLRERVYTYIYMYMSAPINTRHRNRHFSITFCPVAPCASAAFSHTNGVSAVGRRRKHALKRVSSFR